MPTDSYLQNGCLCYHAGIVVCLMHGVLCYHADIVMYPAWCYGDRVLCTAWCFVLPFRHSHVTRMVFCVSMTTDSCVRHGVLCYRADRVLPMTCLFVLPCRYSPVYGLMFFVTMPTESCVRHGVFHCVPYCGEDGAVGR